MTVSGVEVRGLRKSFGGRDILHDVSFRANPGDILSVIGPSGCGKTTLFRCILGELTPDEGRVLLAGEDVTDRPVRDRGVGIVYQNYALFPHLTAEENVAYGLKARGTPRAQVLDRVRAMFELAQLTGKEARYPRELSGGERQRVALARALAIQPRVLLLDEAFAALDATTRSDVVQQVREIVKRLKLTTLLVTHDQEEALLFGRHVLVLNEGRVVTMGTPTSIITHPHPFIQDFVKMVLLTRAKVETDPSGHPSVSIEGQRFRIRIPGVSPGDEVHVMIKKGPKSEHIEVWPHDKHL